MIDVVLPVYNSPFHALNAINSVLAQNHNFNLYIINDGSDSYTTQVLHEVARKDNRCTLILNKSNIGYLKSVNKGISEGTGEYVVLLNSDAVLPDGALERISRRFSSNPDVGVINAVSTWANWTRIPFPDGANLLTLAKIVSESGDPELLDIWNASGFFFAVPRKVYAEHGLFDEAYSPGYWEEADFCMRVLQAGLRVTVDPQLYVYHHGWGSFNKSGRDENMSRNKDIFMSRWKDEFAQFEKKWRRRNPISNLIQTINDTTLLPKAAAKRICFVFESPEALGPTLEIFEIANSMALRGIDTSIIIINEGQTSQEFDNHIPLYIKPTVVSSLTEAVVGEADALVPVGLSAGIRCEDYVSSSKSELPIVHLIQSSPSDDIAPDQIGRLLENCVFIPQSAYYESGLIAREAHDFLRPVNRSMFYPGSDSSGAPLTIIYLSDMAASQGYASLIPTLAGVDELHLATQLRGQNKSTHDATTRYPDVAKLLRRSRAAFIFGHDDSINSVALQAMACGCVPIVDLRYGDTSFLKHKVNCYLFDGDASGAVQSAADYMLAHQSERLRQNALKTAEQHDLQVQTDKLAEVIGGVE